ncbi:hypothetical protein, partial [Agathobacter rectalis]|uniref:hypothetical protein n=1 Tax=Agathobacter rectalis TaxID=39491 RepID=UPI0027D34C52
MWQMPQPPINMICFFALHLLYRTPFADLNPQEKNFLNNFLLSVLRHVPDNIFYRKGVFNGNYTANQLLIHQHLLQLFLSG